MTGINAYYIITIIIIIVSKWTPIYLYIPLVQFHVRLHVDVRI